MSPTTMATFAGLLLAGPLFVLPATAQIPNVQQLLQGLLSGNQDQDRALRDAFERGYQRGREDEARLHTDRDRRDRVGQDRRGPRGRDADGYEDDRYDGGRRPHRDERRSDPPYGQQGGPYYGR